MMYFSVSQPAVPTTWLAMAKRQCRIADSESAWDDELAQYLDVAMRAVQSSANRQLVTATVTLYRDSFPSGSICIPYGPLASVTQIDYTDTDGVSQTLATSVYAVDTVRDAGAIHLKYNQSWPSTHSIENAITITYVAGVAAANVPPQAVQAVMLLTSHMFENHEPIVVGGSINALPLSYEYLINQIKTGEGVI